MIVGDARHVEGSSNGNGGDDDGNSNGGDDDDDNQWAMTGRSEATDSSGSAWTRSSAR